MTMEDVYKKIAEIDITLFQTTEKDKLSQTIEYLDITTLDITKTIDMPSWATKLDTTLEFEKTLKDSALSTNLFNDLLNPFQNNTRIDLYDKIQSLKNDRYPPNQVPTQLIEEKTISTIQPKEQITTPEEQLTNFLSKIAPDIELFYETVKNCKKSIFDINNQDVEATYNYLKPELQYITIEDVVGCNNYMNLPSRDIKSFIIENLVHRLNPYLIGIKSIRKNKQKLYKRFLDSQKKN